MCCAAEPLYYQQARHVATHPDASRPRAPHGMNAHASACCMHDCTCMATTTTRPRVRMRALLPAKSSSQDIRSTPELSSSIRLLLAMPTTRMLLARSGPSRLAACTVCCRACRLMPRRAQAGIRIREMRTPYSPRAHRRHMLTPQAAAAAAATAPHNTMQSHDAGACGPTWRASWPRRAEPIKPGPMTPMATDSMAPVRAALPFPAGTVVD